MRETEFDRVTPIDQGSLTVGRSYAVQGYYVQKHTATQARRLVVILQLDDPARMVTLPLEFSSSDAETLAEQLA